MLTQGPIRIPSVSTMPLYNLHPKPELRLLEDFGLELESQTLSQESLTRKPLALAPTQLRTVSEISMAAIVWIPKPL